MICVFTNFFWNYTAFITASPGFLPPMWFAAMTCQVLSRISLLAFQD